MRVTKLLFSLTALLLAGTISYAQPSHPKSPHDTVKGKDITITYGRPYKKGREIFGANTQIAPYGKVYRIGADEATTVKFDKDVTFAGKPVKAGRYAMFGIPGEKEWTIILNSKADQWGLAHDANKDKDILSVTVPVKKLSTPVEQLTIKVGKDIAIMWDTVEVDIPVK